MEFRFDNNGNMRTGSIDPSTFSSANNTWSDANINTGRTSTVRRKSAPSSISDFEISVPKIRKKKTAPKATYIAPARSKKRVKTKRKSLDFTWNKMGLLLSAALILRLVFMEGGVIDYYVMQDAIASQHSQLEMVKAENTQLVSQIHDLKTNPIYQKKVARDHLGVIANNEFLILFAQDQH